MKYIISLHILALFSLMSVNGQEISRNEIDRHVKNIFPNAIIDTSTMYIVDGYPVLKSQIESYLSNYDFEIIGFNYLDYESVSKTSIFDKRFNIVIIITEKSVTRKRTKKNFKICKRMFSDDTLTKPYSLVIDDEMILHENCEFVISNLKRKNIKSVIIIDKPVSTRIFGQNGQNGLIEIRTNWATADIK